MHNRENALKEWVANAIKSDNFIINSLNGDASFRRYFRLEHNGETRIVMDAPPEKENLEPFIHVAQTLSKAGVTTPHIYAQDNQNGFLLLSDFGDQLLLEVLKGETADTYYQKAISSLLDIQKCSIDDPFLPEFNQAFMLKEMSLCSEWFFNAYLKLDLSHQEQELISTTMSWIATELIKQPQVFIHRDYHSRNLMLLKDQQLGVIDFQDAMRGPVAYDLVSLLKDCYISWPRTKILEWLEFFHEQSPHAKLYPLKEFIRAFDICGLQRHLKVLGVFCRLKLRDNKDGYIKDLPLTLNYVLDCTETYEELHPLNDLFQKRVYLP